MFPIVSQSPVKPPIQIVAPAAHKNLSQVSFQAALPKLGLTGPIWEEFEAITKIARGSGNERQIKKYLIRRLTRDLPKGQRFKIKRTSNNTVIAYRNLNRQRNNAVVTLQAHNDMVEVQASKSKTRVPIEMHLKDGWLYANDRTLGADNGIGMAQMLAIAKDPEFKNMPIQLIFTHSEETGCKGAKSLKARDFYSPNLINLDTEVSGKLTTSCPSVARFLLNEKIKMHSLQSDDFEKISVNISGAKGGHSAYITNDSLNPIQALLKELKEIKDLKVVNLSGGSVFNAVPTDAGTEFLVPKNKANEVIAALQANLEKLKQQKLADNPNLTFTISSQNAQRGVKFVNPEFQTKMFDSLEALPTGIISQFEDGFTKTTQNLGVLKIGDGKFHAWLCGRSADKIEDKALVDKTSSVLSGLFNKQISVHEHDPIWVPKQNSALIDTAIKSYSDTSGGIKPIISKELGGLETAVFVEKKPGLDCISIGPYIVDMHSAQERVKVDTVMSTHDWLKNIIRKLQNKN